MGGKSKKILEIVVLASKNRMTLPLNLRKILKIKKGDYLMFTRERDGILMRRLDRFAFDTEDDKILVDGANQEFKRNMNPQHVEILTVLKNNKSLTAEDIARTIDASEDSVRGRISELRNTFKFNIELDNITKRYTWKEWN